MTGAKRQLHNHGAFMGGPADPGLGAHLGHPDGLIGGHAGGMLGGHGPGIPGGHPITHPGFSTLGYPGHAMASLDIKVSGE